MMPKNEIHVEQAPDQLPNLANSFYIPCFPSTVKFPQIGLDFFGSISLATSVIALAAQVSQCKSWKVLRYEYASRSFASPLLSMLSVRWFLGCSTTQLQYHQGCCVGNIPQNRRLKTAIECSIETKC